MCVRGGLMAKVYPLYCLGTPRLTNEAGEEVQLRTRKHLALLVFLACEHEVAHRRDWLVEFLWPGSSEARGRSSLATGLNAIRTAVGRDVLVGNQTTVQLRRDRIPLDVDRLLAGDVLGDEVRPALDLNGFLTEFDIPDAPEFDHWRERERSRLQPAIKAGLVALMAHARRSGDAGRLGHWADRLLALDDLAEEGIRGRMEVAALAGDRTGAIRVYETWADRLLRELGATPSRQVERLAARLRHRTWERPPGRAVAEVRTEQWRSRAFCGRRREFRAIYGRWEESRQGDPRHVLLLGESGVGKTTLADRVATAIGLEGGAVARVRCFELERGIPYAAVSSAVVQLLDQPGAARANPQALAELGRFVPQVRARFANLPAPAEAPGEAIRIQFAEAVIELLTAVAEEHPVALVIDDLHITDEVSLSVLHFVIRRLEGVPWMFLATARGDLLERSTGATRIRDRAEALRVVVTPLPPLPMDDGAEYLEALVEELDRKPSVMERRVLLAASGGYPLALEHLVADWARRGGASLALSLGGMTPDVASLSSQAYHRLSGALAVGLSPRARLVLGTAAILDQRMGELPLYGRVGLDPGHTLEAITELVARGALRDVAGRLEFASPMIRGAAYLDVPSVLRKQTHARVADDLLARYAEGEAVPGLELAWHCVRGERLDRVAEHLLRGAEEANLAGAPHEAEAALRSGMDRLQGDELVEGKVLLAKIQQDFSQWRESLDTLHFVRALPLRHASMVSILRIGSRLHLGELDWSHRLAAITLLERHLADATLADEVRLTSGHWLVRLAGKAGGHPSRTEALIVAVSQQAAAAKDEVLALRWSVLEARLRYECFQIDEARELLELAENHLATRLPRSALLAFIRQGLGVVHQSQASYREAISPTRLAYDAAVDLDNDQTARIAASNLALAHLRLGHYEDALDWANKSLRRTGLTDNPELDLDSTYIKAAALTLLGRLSDSKHLLQDSGRLFIQPISAARLMIFQLRSADVMMLGGDARKALSLARAALLKGPIFPVQREAGLLARWLVLLGETGELIQLRDDTLTILQAGLDRMDAIDQAEVYLAAKAAGRHTMSLTNSKRAITCLKRLPEATHTHLARLGFPTYGARLRGEPTALHPIQRTNAN